MARFGQMTDAASVDNIDVVEAAARIAAKSKRTSTFAALIATEEKTRKHQYSTDADMDFVDGTVGAAPDEVEYTPTSIQTAATPGYLDAILDQDALADAATSGTPLIDQVVRVGNRAYSKRLDAKCAALYAKVSTSSPDHVIGGSTELITAPLLDQAIELHMIAGNSNRLALVVSTARISQVMAIPGMRDKSIRGSNGSDGVSGPNIGLNDKQLVAGYGGVLDIYHSDQIVSSSGYQNLMISLADGDMDAGIVNPYTPFTTPSGKAAGKLMIDPDWNASRRVIELNMSVMEDFEFRDSTTASTKAVVLVSK